MEGSVEPEATRYGSLVLAFAQAVVAGDFEAAHGMLSSDLQQQTPPSELRLEYDDMLATYDELYGDRQVTDVQLVTVDDMAQWPARDAHDVGWAYVGISGVNWTEAVAGIVEDREGVDRIRALEWGRP
jgi:hypothetical protein